MVIPSLNCFALHSRHVRIGFPDRTNISATGLSCPQLLQFIISGAAGMTEREIAGCLESALLNAGPPIGWRGTAEARAKFVIIYRHPSYRKL